MTSHEYETPYSPEQLWEVSSLVHDELKCISLSSIHLLDPTISKRQASYMLDDIINKELPDSCTDNRKKSYQVTKCVVIPPDNVEQNERTKTTSDCVSKRQEDENEIVPCTVMKLVKQEISYNQEEKKIVQTKLDDERYGQYESTTMSLAFMTNDVTNDEQTIVSFESISTAHERYMARFHDMMKDRTILQWPSTHGNKMMDAILPSTPVQDILYDTQTAVSNVLDEVQCSEPHVNVKAISKKSHFNKLSEQKKGTSAASFFGKAPQPVLGKNEQIRISSSSVKIPSSNGSKSNDTVTVKKKVEKIPDINTNSNNHDGKENTNVSIINRSKIQDNQTNVKKNERWTNKKPVTASSSVNVGNADDFVGDEDDEDDEDIVMSGNNDNGNYPTERKKSTVNRKNVKNKQITDENAESFQSSLDLKNDEDEEVDIIHREVLPVRGAMDSFVSSNVIASGSADSNHDDNGGRRRRRKKTIQETKMDAKGYIITETQEVWEDIESDDDVQERKGSQSNGLGSQTSVTSGSNTTTHKKQAVLLNASSTLGTKKAVKPVSKGNMKQGSIMGFFGKK